MPLAIHNSQLSTLNFPRDPLSDLTDAQRSQVGSRLALVRSHQRLVADFTAAGRLVRDATESFLLAHADVTRSTLYKWLSLYKSDGPIGLVDRRSQRGYYSSDPSHSSPPVATIGPAAWRRFLDLWLTPHQRPVTLCYQIVLAEAESRGLQPARPPAERGQDSGFGVRGSVGAACGRDPSRPPPLTPRPSPPADWAWPNLRTIQRAAQQVPATNRDYYRLGEAEWRRRHSPHIHRDYLGLRPGQMWCADFHQFDIFCRRSETDATIVRPLLSAWLDLRSRMLVGWDIGERETQDAVLLGFRYGVERLGPPQQAVIDNGKPYRAQGVSGGRPSARRKIGDEAYVRSVFAGLNVIVHFSIPYNPDSKPIEGWFGKMEMDFGKTFEAYCSGDLKSECFRQAHALATSEPERCKTVAELRELFSQWLQAYHATPLSADDVKGLSPAQVYEQLDPIPRAIVPEGALDVLLMRTTQPLKVGQYGVRHNGIEYGMTDPRVQQMHAQEVVLRIDPVDASYVIVCDLQGRPLLRAVNNRLALNEIDQDHVAAGQRTIKRAKRLARSIRDGELRPAMEDLTTLAIRAKNKAAQAMQQLVRATGTDGKAGDWSPEAGGVGAACSRDPSGRDSAICNPQSAIPQRGVSPLRSDFADAIDAFRKRVSPPLESSGPASLTEVDILFERVTETPLSLADALEGLL